jgi:hypothetical protein
MDTGLGGQAIGTGGAKGMGAAASFHPDQAGWQGGEEREHLAPGQLLAQR